MPRDKVFTYKKVWIGDKPLKATDEIVYDSPVRLFKNGVSIGDYYRNLRTGDCNVVFYIHGMLHRSVMLSAQHVKKAREMLRYYGMTGKIPHPEGLTQEALFQGAITPGMETNGLHFPFAGIMDIDNQDNEDNLE